jgi:hypothetical protein
MKLIAESPSPEMYRSGLEIDCQCARCGSSVVTDDCKYCEDGFYGHDCGEDCCCCLYPEENVPCQYCRGTGVWHRCLSSPEWCKANPLPGREAIERGAIEWFTVARN